MAHALVESVTINSLLNVSRQVFEGEQAALVIARAVGFRVRPAFRFRQTLNCGFSFSHDLSYFRQRGGRVKR